MSSLWCCHMFISVFGELYRRAADGGPFAIADCPQPISPTLHRLRSMSSRIRSSPHIFDGSHARRAGNPIEPNFRGFDRHLHYQKNVPEFIRSQVLLKTFFIRPDPFEQERFSPQSVLVEAAAETPLLGLDPFDHGCENAPGLSAFPGWDQHPNGRVNTDRNIGLTAGFWRCVIIFCQRVPLT